MSILTWEEKYSVGIDEIDKQHKHLIELINQLYDAMRTGHGKEKLQSVLSELIEYTDYHFKTEEKLFDTYHYAQNKEHRVHHDSLRSQVMEFNQKFHDGRSTLSLELLSFLKDWIKNHILNEDMQYKEFLTSKMNR